MKRMMKALVYVQKGKLELREVPVPQIGEEDILLKVMAAGICGSDMHFYHGEWGPEEGQTVIPGHEFAGVIEEAGSRVDSYWKVGDRVVSENTAYICGRCPACQAGHFVACPKRTCIGCDMDGGFAQYVRIPGEVLRVYPNTLLKLPEEIDMKEAPCLEPAANSYKALIQEARIKPGESIAVIGPGALGLMAIHLAYIAGAVNIILLARSSALGTRIPIAKKLGATHVILTDQVEDPIAEAKKIAGPAGIPVVIDDVSNAQCTQQSIDLVRNEGTVIRIGNGQKPAMLDMEAVTGKAIRYQGHMGYDTESWVNCMALAAAGKLRLADMITHYLTLEEYQDGYDAMENRTAGKVILLPNLG